MWPGGRDPAANRASTRPVDVDVVPTHDVSVSECPGDEILCGEDVAAPDPRYISWTIASRIGWRGIARQTAPATSGLE
ncbi:hypothetical protein GCM10027452_01050 [Micromonospora halotolerans]